MRVSRLYPNTLYIDNCESYEPMFLSRARLAKLCGKSNNTIRRVMSKSDDEIKAYIKEHARIEVEILHDLPESCKYPRSFIIIKGKTAK